MYIRHLSDIAGYYDGFILDLWGVVHDGEKPYPDVIATLREMKRAKRKIWLLSNAPRRAWVVADKLAQMGIDTGLYDGLLTSGEATWQALRDRYLAEYGRKFFHLGRKEADRSLYEDIDAEKVETPEEADFVLNSGVVAFADTADQYRVVLERCAARGLPMICANPDRIVHVGAQLVVCAGTLAEMYEEMEGKVTWFGKPYRAVYSHCLMAMGSQRVAAVGDSMITDIAGATGAGLDSILVTSGIHREDLGGAAVADVDENRLQEFFKKYPYRPNYVTPRLFW